MGGEDTGCTEDTTNVFLESACSIRSRSPPRAASSASSPTRATASSAASIPSSSCPGAEVATRLILEFCGGEPSEIVTPAQARRGRRRLVPPGRGEALGGLDVPETEIERILTDLGFAIEAKSDAVTVAVPSWRIDVDGEADIVEEVLRIHGYDKIPSVSMAGRRHAAGGGHARAAAPAHRAPALAARGMIEARDLFVHAAAQADLFGGGDEALKLANPIAADLDMMRPSMLPNLSGRRERNAGRGYPEVALFEVGPQFARHAGGPGDGRHRHPLRRPGRATGTTAPPSTPSTPRPTRWPPSKPPGGPVNAPITTDAPGWYHPGRSGMLRSGNKVLAAFGELHPRVLRRLDVKAPVVGFEVMLDKMPPPKAKGKTRPLLRPSPFQPVERDFAFVVGDDVPAEKLVRAAAGRRSADRRGQRVRRLYRRGHRRGQEVGRHRRAPAADRRDPDRRGDRRGRREGRRRGGQGTGGVLRG